MMIVKFEKTITAEVEINSPMFKQDLEHWANGTAVPVRPIDLAWLIKHGAARCAETPWKVKEADAPLPERKKRGRPRKGESGR